MMCKLLKSCSQCVTHPISCGIQMHKVEDINVVMEQILHLDLTLLCVNLLKEIKLTLKHNVFFNVL